MGLREYKKKRAFSRTKEPSASRRGPAARELVYVIQKHQATHLHYDLRLEEGGVLKSWAVPKVPVSKTGIRRLAMQVEDHPLGYETFEGTIPEHEYGAGTVEIWDRGTYRPLETTPQARLFEIRGKRLKGLFVLVHIKSREGRENTWLFFKSPKKAKAGDGAAEPES